MERVSKEEFRKSIIEYFETNSKRSISEAKKEITKRLKSDGFCITNGTTDIRI
jgi:hypothetical protein